MVTQLDSPDGKPRKDPGRPSPTFVETDDRRSIDRSHAPIPESDTATGSASTDEGPDTASRKGS